MFDDFGRMDLNGLNELAKNLLKEGDTESLNNLAKENGLEDIVDEFIQAGGEMPLTDGFSAGNARLTIEMKDAKSYEKDIPAAPIADYLKSRCDEEEIALAIMNPKNSLKECLSHIKREAEKRVTRETPYLPDQEVYNMALNYYLGGER